MGRLGVPLADVSSLVSVLGRSLKFNVEGIMTHYSRADDDSDFTAKQVFMAARLTADNFDDAG